MSFAGAVTTTGRSSVEDEPASETEHEEAGDPVVAAYLAFLEQDLVGNPGNLTGIGAEELSGLSKLLDGVSVTDDDRLPDDITF